MKKIAILSTLFTFLMFNIVEAGQVRIKNKSSISVYVSIHSSTGTVQFSGGTKLLKKGEEVTLTVSTLPDETGDIKLTYKEGVPKKTYSIVASKYSDNRAAKSLFMTWVSGKKLDMHALNNALCSDLKPDENRKVTIRDSMLGKSRGLGCWKKSFF